MDASTPSPTAPLPTQLQTPPDGNAIDTTRPRWELADQAKAAWRRIKWTILGAAGVGGIFVIGQLFLFYDAFARVHPALGVAFVLGLALLLGRFVGVPLFRFFRIPSIAAPPDVSLDDPALTRADLHDRIKYDATYLKRLQAHPSLAHEQDAIAALLSDLESLKRDIDRPAADAAQELQTLERDRLAPLLTPLDKEVDDYIRKESLAVGAATAVSLNGSIDAFIVLWRNVNMVSRIATLYYGRPSLRLSLLILRDVLGAVLLSRALDDVTDAAGEAVGGLFTRLGGMVVGPMLDGSVNALVTTKIGHVAKKRCRSFDVWSEARAQRATREVFDYVKREANGLVSDLVSACGGFVKSAASAADGVKDVAVDAAGRVMAVPKSAWSLIQNMVVAKPTQPDASPKT